MVSNISAMNAYQNQLKLAKDASETLGSDQTGGTGSSSAFGQMLESQMNDFVNTQNTADTAKMNAITGTGDITDLVTAIANAELALNTIVAIRDRAISAYQDIIRMPI